jgi:hypothetical protein
MDVIPVSALLYIINFANCYQNGSIKLENNFFVSTLGKLLVFLVNYAYYTTLFFIMNKLGKGCFGSFGTHYRYFDYFLWGKIVLTYDQLELRTALGNELSS